ncbi:glycosyltransferase [Christiangramia sabulilitoris]|uniref:Glycosyltransferase n=1 Tax=Christiangramia sabulilitoris TaxID=2583991 RepID=A0A550HZZ9_9FLAO|nr:glycosyltransferase [Christiangramia sabulilitoris]TRO64307.1 glycosyltransferase [Christiangramia sabulilitoris]
MKNKRILVGVLNWGLGHATRCIPIIRELISLKYQVIIASDGAAFLLLKKEFPGLLFEELPPYNITYTKQGSLLKWKLLLNTPHILRTIKAEYDLTQNLVEKHQLTGIISDNRWGVRSELLNKNVFITHQLNVLSGNTTFLSSYIQQQYIKKFDQCWVPDVENEPNLSGKLGHVNKESENIKYLGVLSRFKKKEMTITYNYLVLLSGPEPQRGILEKLLSKEFKNTESKTLFIRGVFSEEEICSNNPNLSILNYSYGKELESYINQSEIIIARSGYTTVMDLSKLEKKAFFIPTPGQEEQEYLAERLKNNGITPCCDQKDFRISKLKEVENYKGLSNFGNNPVLRDRLAFFQGK